MRELVAGLPLAQIGSGKAVCVLLGTPLALLALHRLPRWRRPAAVACAATVVPAVLVWQLFPSSPLPPPKGLRITFLDVGQGDSILLQVAEGAVLVDEGPPEGNVAQQLRTLGVRRLAAVVLTHPQRDHIGGAETVLRRIAVDQVLDPRLTRSSPYERAALAEAAKRGVEVVETRAGDTFRLGRLHLRVLWPDRPGTESEDPNLLPVVLLATYGEVDALLTADAETDVTARLLSRPVEILKVAHHGSADAGLESELRELRPEVAVISCGRDNDYGHPRPSTVAALRASPGLSLYRTDEDGRVVARVGRRPDHGPEGSLSRVGAVAAAPDLKPVYLLTGSDRPKIETALARLRRHFEPEAVELVTAQEVSGPDAAALCNVGSLFGDARLVVIEGVDGRRNAEGRLASGWKVADVKAIEEYLSSPAPGTVLALVAEELKKDAPLTKACAKAGDVLAFEVPKRNVANWVAERFKQAGARAEPDACAALVHLVGDDFHQLANEIDKLALWAGDEPIGQNEVELLVAAVAETPTFALTDAWAQRDGGRTLAASETIFEREGRPRRDTAPRMAGALTNHLAFMRRCQRSPPRAYGRATPRRP